MNIFTLTGTIFVDSEKANESISKTEEKSKSLSEKLGDGIKTAGAWALGIGAAAAAVGGAMLGVASNSAETADRIDKMSSKIGLSKTAFQEWDYVLGQNGMDIGKLETGMKTLTAAMENAQSGTASSIENFKTLGLTWEDGNGKLKSQEEMMNETIIALANMENGTEKARLATELFGKAGVDMMPMLNGGAEGIEELKNRAHELGLVMSDESVTAGVVLGDTMDDVKKSFGAVATQIGVSVMPMVQLMLNWILENMPVIQETVGNVVGFIQAAISVLVAVWEEHGETIKAVTSAVFSVVQTVIETAMGVIQGIINVVMGIISGDWSRAWDGVKGIFKTVWDGMAVLLPGLIEAIFTIIRGTFDTFKGLGKSMINYVWDGMKSVWTSISNWVSEKVKWLADKLAFWRSGNNEISGAQSIASSSSLAVNGSHAAGLAYVPYNGYIAQLHEGERVLTKDENKDFASNNTVDRQIAFNLNIGTLVADDYGLKQLERKLREIRIGEDNRMGVSLT